MTTLAAWVCIFSPLTGVVIIPLLERVSAKARDLGALLFSFIASLAALCLLPKLFHPEELPLESTLEWIEVPIEIEFGVLIDPLSVVMANVVAVVSFIIMVYCLGYMKQDTARTRFWMLMNGFIGSMLLLVLSSNLLFLFIGWKLVGLCSYGLVGYYYQDQRKYWIGGPSPTTFVMPSQASLKALLVTGAGDMLMLGGILVMYFYAGTLNFLELYETAPIWLSSMAESPGMVALVSVLLLAGPLGKSAQFPFHEWLPEAMAGPGPVSALIHAATMVKSGVYFVARVLPLFYYGYWVAEIEAASWFFHLTAWVGAFTALLAATQGMVALELKKIFAYSTVSQIGYMMLGLGAAGLSPTLLVDGYTSSIFHLVNHSLFKACLFLSAGTIIHAVRSIYIQDMGAIRKHLPFTWICTLVAALSLMGLPPFPGFWSKDAVLVVALKGNVFLFVLALVTIAATAFYTVRFLGIVFFRAESINLANVKEEGKHLSDGTISMRMATGLLTVFIVVAGIAGLLTTIGGTQSTGLVDLEQVLHRAFSSNLEGDITAAVASTTVEGSVSHVMVTFLGLLFLAAGAFPAYSIYVTRRTSPDDLMGRYAPLQAFYVFFWNRWLIDVFYRRVFVDGTLRLARFVAADLEERWDQLVHRRLPLVFTEGIQRLLHKLHTETEELVYNVSYVLLLFVLFLTFLLLRTGGS